MRPALIVVPARAPAGGDPLPFQFADDLFEVRVGEGAKPLKTGDVCAIASDRDTLTVRAIDRDGLVIASPSPETVLRSGDIVQLKGRAPVIQSAIAEFGLVCRLNLSLLPR